MDKLKQFYLDGAMREEVRNYLNDFIKKTAVECVLTRKDTSGLADAYDILNKGIAGLETIYKPKQESKPQEVE